MCTRYSFRRHWTYSLYKMPEDIDITGGWDEIELRWEHWDEKLCIGKIHSMLNTWYQLGNSVSYGIFWRSTAHIILEKKPSATHCWDVYIHDEKLCIGHLHRMLNTCYQLGKRWPMKILSWDENIEMRNCVSGRSIAC